MIVRLTTDHRPHGPRGTVLDVSDQVGNAWCSCGVAEAIQRDAPDPALPVSILQLPTGWDDEALERFRNPPEPEEEDEDDVES